MFHSGRLISFPPYLHSPPLLSASAAHTSVLAGVQMSPLLSPWSMLYIQLPVHSLSLLISIEHLFINRAPFFDNLQQISAFFILSLLLLSGAILYSWPPQYLVLGVLSEQMVLYNISNIVRPFREISSVILPGAAM